MDVSALRPRRSTPSGTPADLPPAAVPARPDRTGASAQPTRILADISWFKCPRSSWRHSVYLQVPKGQRANQSPTPLNHT